MKIGSVAVVFLSWQIRSLVCRFASDAYQFGLLDRFCAAELRFRTRFVIRFFELCEGLVKSDRDRPENAEIVGDTFLTVSAFVDAVAC